MIHLVDKEVGEEGIAQHRQAHPDTTLSTASLRESLIVGGIFVCEGVSLRELLCLHCGAYLERGVSFMGLIIVYFACM